MCASLSRLLRILCRQIINSAVRPIVRYSLWINQHPTTTKKRPETSYNDQETTYNDLQRTGSSFMEPLYLKNNQLEGLNNTKKS